MNKEYYTAWKAEIDMAPLEALPGILEQLRKLKKENKRYRLEREVSRREWYLHLHRKVLIKQVNIPGHSVRVSTTFTSGQPTYVGYFPQELGE